MILMTYLTYCSWWWGESRGRHWVPPNSRTNTHRRQLLPPTLCPYKRSNKELVLSLLLPLLLTLYSRRHGRDNPTWSATYSAHVVGLGDSPRPSTRGATNGAASGVCDTGISPSIRIPPGMSHRSYHHQFRPTALTLFSTTLFSVLNLERMGCLLSQLYFAKKSQICSIWIGCTLFLNTSLV